MVNEQKREMRRLRGLGYTQKETAALLGVAVRTIIRAEKADAVEDIDEDIGDIFEDIEEGWRTHYTKELGTTTPEAASWTGIVYEESAPADWQDGLVQTGCQLMISPPHNADTWKRDDPDGRYKAGDIKKSHYHYNIKFPQKISLKKASMVLQRITHGPLPQPVMDEAGLEAYMSHHDRDGNVLEGKTEYDADAVMYYNGWVAEPTEKDKAAMRLKLERYLTIEKICNYTIAVNRVRVELGEDYSKLMRQDAHHFRGMIEANRYLSDAEQHRLRWLIDNEIGTDIAAEEWWQNRRNTDNKEKENKEEKTYEGND